MLLYFVRGLLRSRRDATVRRCNFDEQVSGFQCSKCYLHLSGSDQRSAMLELR